MSKPKRPALIAAGYALSVGGGLAAVAVNELFMPADVAQTSPGMVAFGDMVLFVLVTGFFSLAPTWFLLWIRIQPHPRVKAALEPAPTAPSSSKPPGAGSVRRKAETRPARPGRRR